ncbi:MAG: thiamine phosphate synthase [Gemmatimonadota bacterium]
MTRVPPVHVICTEKEAARTSFPDDLRGLVEAGRRELALHLRLRGVTDRRLYDVAVLVAEAARETGGRCAINGRPDVALTARADAVQLGRGAIPIAAARAWLGDRLTIGASVHAAAEATAAVTAGADYLLLGTIYPTPTHPGRPGAGPALVRETAAALARAGYGAVPVVAIGGIHSGRIGRVRAAGAVGVAVRRAVWASRDPPAALRDLIDRFRSP